MSWLFSKGSKSDSKTQPIQGGTSQRGVLGNLLPRKAPPPESEANPTPSAAPQGVPAAFTAMGVPSVNPYRTDLSLDDEAEELRVPAEAQTETQSESAPTMTLSPQVNDEEDDFGLGNLATPDLEGLPSDCLNTLLSDNVLSMISTNPERANARFEVNAHAQPTSVSAPAANPLAPAKPVSNLSFSIEAEQIEGLAATRTSAQAAATDPNRVIEPPKKPPSFGLPEFALPDVPVDLENVQLEDLHIEPDAVPTQVVDASDAVVPFDQLADSAEIAAEDSSEAEASNFDDGSVENSAEPENTQVVSEPRLADIFNDQEIAATEDGTLDFSSLEAEDYAPYVDDEQDEPALQAVSSESSLDASVDLDEDYEVLEDPLALETTEETLIIHYDGETDTDLTTIDEDSSPQEDTVHQDDEEEEDELEALLNQPVVCDAAGRPAHEGFKPNLAWLNVGSPEAIPVSYGLGVVFESGPSTLIQVCPIAAYEMASPTPASTIASLPSTPLHATSLNANSTVLTSDRTEQIEDPRNRTIYEAARSAKQDMDAMIQAYFSEGSH